MEKTKYTRRKFLKFLCSIPFSASLYRLIPGCKSYTSGAAAIARSGTNVLDKEKSTREKLVWQYERGLFQSEELVEEINKKLDEKGLEVELQFKRLPVSPVFSGIEEYPLEEADIVTMSSDSNIGTMVRYFYSSAQQGKLEAWDNFFMTEEGSILYSSYPEKYWKGFQIEGKCFGILNLRPEYKQYLVFNKKIVEKYHLSLENLTPESFFEMADAVYEKEIEKGNKTFISFLWHDICDAGSVEPVTGLDGLGAQKTEDGWVIKSLLDFPASYGLMKKRQDAFEKGSMSAGNKFFFKGNFLCGLITSYCQEAAALKQLSRMDKEAGIMPEDLIPIEIQGWWDTPYRGAGYKTVVPAASRHREMAQKVLAAIYTDPEISELFAYGVENIHYEVVEGKISPLGPFYDSMYGNPFLTKPSLFDTDDKKERCWDYFEKEAVSELTGFQFDDSGIKQEWKDITAVYINHHLFYLGMSEEPEKEEEELRRELEEAGIAKVSETLTEQCNRYVLQNMTMQQDQQEKDKK